MGGGWEETAIGQIATALHSTMNVEGLELAIGKDEARALASPARLLFSVPDGEDLEPPAEQGGPGKHICEDRVVETVATIWGATPGEAEGIYLRLLVAVRKLGLSRTARRYGRVQWTVGAGRVGSAGVKISVPLALRFPVADVDLRKALVLTTALEAESASPGGDKPEGF
jgi:hypothetical protein